MWESAVRCRLLMDWEGPLLDPGPGMLLALRRACLRAGRPLPVEEDLSWVLNTPLEGALEALLGPGSEAERTQVMANIPVYFQRWGRYKCREQAGARAMLGNLNAASSVETVLFSAETAPGVQTLLAHYDLERCFDRILCARRQACTQCKAATAERLSRQCDPADRLLVWLTDDPRELRFAKYVGIPSIAAGWGRATPEELEAEAPAMLAPEPHDVLRLLAGLGSAREPAVAVG